MRDRFGRQAAAIPYKETAVFRHSHVSLSSGMLPSKLRVANRLHQPHHILMAEFLHHGSLC